MTIYTSVAGGYDDLLNDHVLDVYKQADNYFKSYYLDKNPLEILYDVTKTIISNSPITEYLLFSILRTSGIVFLPPTYFILFDKVNREMLDNLKINKISDYAEVFLGGNYYDAQGTKEVDYVDFSEKYINSNLGDVYNYEKNAINVYLLAEGEIYRKHARYLGNLGRFFYAARMTLFNIIRHATLKLKLKLPVMYISGAEGVIRGIPEKFKISTSLKTKEGIKKLENYFLSMMVVESIERENSGLDNGITTVGCVVQMKLF